MISSSERWSIWGGLANIHHTQLTLITLKQQLHKDLVNCQPLYFGAKAVNHCRQALWLFLYINQQTVYINYLPPGKNSKEFNLDCNMKSRFFSLIASLMNAVRHTPVFSRAVRLLTGASEDWQLGSTHRPPDMKYSINVNSFRTYSCVIFVFSLLFVRLLNRGVLCRDKRESLKTHWTRSWIKYRKGSFKVLLSLSQHFAFQTFTGEIESGGDRRTNTSYCMHKDDGLVSLGFFNSHKSQVYAIIKDSKDMEHLRV